MAHELPSLPYDFDALAPHIDEATMRIHHGKHHAAYIAKLNGALEGHADLQGKTVDDLIANLDALPEGIRGVVRNNGGGHANHTLFWQVMAPNAGGAPTGQIADAINGSFGSFDTFKEKFAAAAVGQFGSGWAWLVADGTALSIEASPNQDSPALRGKKAVLGIDVWEHASSLNYQTRRPDSIAAWWTVVNWAGVNRRLG